MKATLIIQEKIVSWNQFYGRKHWSERKKIVDYWHHLVKIECYIQKIPSFNTVHITIKSISKRPIDPDNICAKSIIDGIVHAGVLTDDTPKYVKSVTLISEKGKEEITEVTLNGPCGNKTR